jgi:catechol-2,3-dioxygenase
VIAGDFLFVIFPRPGGAKKPARQRGIGGARHGFTVPRARWGEMLERLRGEGVDFEGPVAHPENGPLGESVYFTDPIGNFFELCWRRDEGHEYHAVLRGGD